MFVHRNVAYRIAGSELTGDSAVNITHANIDMCGHIRMHDLPVIDFILARFRAASRAAKA
ncbi:hypothetical protein RGR602_PC00275 (plasmid) [Rhizobium gallicum bv. gallicum R602sp]|uniref:Uncharacterized protein n=1 Tax=Rhizobium gallicum bv. gallicum R602sp TaxID=1041138 RepID=A0A0B4XCL5_9HYPH|nr:hypothetical protein RGR602_PC00275 [Rhizobium gallicum bv. gallicum R602sp]